MTKNKYPIPPRGFVRAIGVMLLAGDILLIALAIINFAALSWMAYVIILGTLATAYFPIKAIQTGDPEWVLLDVIIPS